MPCSGIDISVIISTRNRAEDLRQTLEALGHLCFPDNTSAEIVIVDNGSTDHTASVVQGFQGSLCVPVRYVSEPKRGLSNARNTGLAKAHGEILLFTDDDIRPPQQWISQMCAPIIAGRAHAVAGNIVVAPHLRRAWMQPIHYSYLAAHEGDTEEPVHMTGANMGFSREVLSQVPQFDTELGAGLLGCCEESLFSWQLKRAGYTILAVPEAAVEHHFQEARLQRGNFLEIAKGIGRSHAYLQYHWEHSEQKHLSFRRLRKEIQLFAGKRTLEQKAMTEEEVSPWEMQAVSHLSLLKQYAIEQKRPRNYTQFGLIKRI